MATQVAAPVRSGSGSRFYQLELKHRPAMMGDIGNLIRIQGVLVGGEGAQALLMLPGAEPYGDESPAYYPSLEEWTDFLQRADDPEVLIMPAKAFHRKLRYEISGFVQQKVWKADGLKCMYCLKPMGEVQLTIDHYTSLEQGGVNNTSNYLTACKRCNKNKGAEEPRAWCAMNAVHAGEFYERYLAERKV